MKTNFLPFLQRAYLDYYGNCVDDQTLDPHACQNACAQVDEHAGIRSGAWVHASYYATLAADPETQATWDTGILAGLIIPLPDLRGSFDGGTPKYVAGWGTSKQSYSGADFKATINDRVYAANWAHYYSLAGKTTWHLVFNTETKGHLTSVPVTVAPKPNITENVDDTIFWATEASWFEYFSPSPFDFPPAVFVCGYTPTP